MRLHTLMETKDKLTLVDLPYALDALAPVMERKVVEFHYKVLSKGYVDRYNAGEGDRDFNYAGAQLHNIFWPSLQKPKLHNLPFGESKELIEKIHGGWDEFKDAFTEAALSLQGSGWCYLAKNGSIKTLKNQTWANDILLPIDLWEHSMSPFTLRKDYLKTIFRIVNWEIVNDRLNLA